ncbi:MAG TPA: hypothetical protein VHA75_08790 [Rugosimonospora sp.]|nr:hypothetical protein [Rugosimonospora sp.]
MATVQLGRVTDRPGARLHAVDVTSTCPYQRRGFLGTSVALTADNAPLVCKRCRPALHAAAETAEVEANRAWGISTTLRGRERAAEAAAVVRLLESPAQRLARRRSDEAFRRQFDAIVAASLTDVAA